MKIRDLQKVYYEELSIYHHIDKLFNGYISNIPEELLDKEVVELGVNFSSGMDCAWMEVYI